MPRCYKNNPLLYELYITCKQNYGACLSQIDDADRFHYCLDAFLARKEFEEKFEIDEKDINTNPQINLALCLLDAPQEERIKILKKIETLGYRSEYDLVKEAVKIKSKRKMELGKATALHNLGLLDWELNQDLDGALQKTQKALDIRMKYYEDWHPSVMSSKVNYATFLLVSKDIGNDLKAINIYSEIYLQMLTMSSEERNNVKQIPAIIKNNVLFQMESLREIVPSLNVLFELADWSYIDWKYTSKKMKYLHETYDFVPCDPAKLNYILNREVTNLSISNLTALDCSGLL